MNRWKKVSALLIVLFSLGMALAGCAEKKDVMGDDTPENEKMKQEEPAAQ